MKLKGMCSPFILFIPQGLTGLLLRLETCFPAFCLGWPSSKCSMPVNDPALLPGLCSPASWEAITEKSDMKGSSMIRRVGITWGQSLLRAQSSTQGSSSWPWAHDLRWSIKRWPSSLGSHPGTQCYLLRWL